MINWARIEELRREVGEDALAEVIELFCEEVEEVLTGLDHAPSSALPERLHFLKGSAMNIGLDSVSQICLAEEIRLKADPLTKVDFAAIRSAYAEARTAIGDIK